MKDYDIQEEVDLLKGKIRQHMHHSILLKHMDMPAPDVEKLSMLYRMFRETECTRQEITTYVVTITLVQAALDAHDLISTDKPNSQEGMTTRQLTILGGDYYSGLYYQLLTELNDIGLIRQIARSIQLINEHKMFLYRSSRTFDETVQNLRVLESGLLKSAAEYFDQPLWAAFFEEYFLLRRLLLERDRMMQSPADPSHKITGRLKVFSSRQERRQQFSQLLDTYIDRAGKAIEKLFSSHSMFETILDGRIWTVFTENSAFKQKFAEEG